MIQKLVTYLLPIVVVAGWLAWTPDRFYGPWTVMSGGYGGPHMVIFIPAWLLHIWLDRGFSCGKWGLK